MRKYVKDEKYEIDESWLGAMATGLSLKFGVTIEKGEHWKADVESKKITYTDSLKWLDKDNAIALLLHETGHLLNTDPINVTPIQKKYPITTHFVVNMLEDVRIDDIMSQAFGNSKYYMDKLNGQSTSIVEDTMKALSSEKATLFQALAENKKNLAHAELLEIQAKKEISFVMETLKKTKSLMPDHPELDTLNLKNLRNVLGSINGVHASKIRDWLYRLNGNEILKDQFIQTVSQYERDQCQVQLYEYQKKDLERRLKNIDNEVLMKTACFIAFLNLKNLRVPPSSNEAKALGQAITDVCIGVEKFETTAKVQDLYETKVLPLIEHLLDEKNEQEKQKQQQEQDAKDGKGKGQDSKKEKEINDKIKKNAKKKGGYGTQEERTQPPLNYKKAYDRIKPTISGYITRYRRILKDNAFDRLEGRFRTGKLTKKRLYKASLNEDKLFQRKSERNNKNYVFSIMIDDSGSMEGSKQQGATNALVHMSEILNSCKVPYEIGYFADDYLIAKELHEPLDRVKVGFKASQSDIGGGTELRAPLKYMIKSLSDHKSPNKIGIVLTDGDVGGDKLKDLISKFESNNPNGIIYGIGVDCKINPSTFGKDRTLMCKDGASIMNALKTILRTHIKTG
jgi:hypothetical protein